MDGWTDKWTDGQNDITVDKHNGQRQGHTDTWMATSTDGWTDRHVDGYRDRLMDTQTDTSTGGQTDT